MRNCIDREAFQEPQTERSNVMKLKPCPFCGAEAIRIIQTVCSNKDFKSFDITVSCIRSACGAKMQFRYTPPRWIKRPETEAKRVSARMWNRRVGDDRNS